MRRKKAYCYLIFILSVLCTGLTAQENLEKHRLTRGKVWITSMPNGSLEKDQTTRFTWLLMYPGDYNANNEVAGGWDASRIFNVAQINGESVGWAWRNQSTQIHVKAKVQSELIKNYNLLDPTQPEEYMQGVIESPKTDRFGKRHMAYELEAKTMVWGLPKYDDFVLVKCKLTNTDDVTFENFYYARSLAPVGPSSPLSTSYDVEYLWDNEVSSDIGFIFYDDTSWPPPGKGDSTIYNIPPGDITGDRGDPGNIAREGSRDRKLYNPYLYAFSFAPQGLTPNKNGEKKVWRNIVSRSDDAPESERYPGNSALESWTQLSDFIGKEQPEMNWRDANGQYLDGDLAGSLWERDPRYVYSIGPYDIAPGESIEWVEIFLAGQMDRNSTILGDTTATLHFVEEGLKSLKENWAAAKELITNNFAVPGNIPPPTPAHAPLLNNDIELLAETGSEIVEGVEKAGVYLTFDAVHLNYTDPLTAQAFATNRLNEIRVVPNPFRQQSGFASRDESKRLAFINIPEKCTIRIYTLSLELVRKIDNEGGGEATWGSTTSKGNDYLLTDFAMNVSPGIYIYHVESHVEGHEGESKTGKIFIIK